MTDAFDAEWDSFDDEWDAAPRDPSWLAKSQRKQDLARAGVEAEHEAEGSTLREDIESGALHAANTLGGSHRWLAAAGPAGMLSAGAIELARQATGTDEALEEAEAQSPFGAGVGRGGAQAAQVALGAPALARGAAAAPALAEDIVLRGMGRAGSAVATQAAKGAPSGGAAAGGGALSRLRDAINEQGGLGGIFGRKAVAKVLDDDTARAAFPKPTEAAPSSGIPWTPAASSSSATASPLRSPLRDLVKFSDPVDDVATSTRGAPREDMPPEVMLGDLRKRVAAARRAAEAEAAPERVTAADVGAAAPKATGEPMIVAGKRVDPSTYKPQDAGAFLEQEAASASANAEKAWRSLPPAPKPRPTQPVTQEMIKAAVEEGVRGGVSLPMLAKHLSKQLGVRVPQYEIAALFKGAQNSLPINKQGYQPTR